MKILLVQPKMNMRPMDTQLKTRMSPSLGLLTLVGLTPEKHTAIIMNENVEKIDFDEKVDLVAITVTVDVIDRAIYISKEFSKRGIKVVAGGIHISSVPEDCQNFFDAICIGMAERVWCKIIADAENGCLKKVYQDMKDMLGDEISSPFYRGIDRKKYLYTNIISTSRGCPHKCAFCYNSCDNNVLKYINRPIDDVIADIKELKTKHIMFVDDNFIGNPEWTYDFLSRIKSLGLKWNAAVTTNIINHLDLLDLMKDTGCQSLFIGFETINCKSLEGINKHQNHIEEYTSIIAEIHRRGIMVNASIVLGLEDDDKQTFKNMLDWLIKNKIETVTAHILTPYPGTVLHKAFHETKRIIDYNLSHYNTSNVVFSHKHLTSTELFDGYIQLYKDFYLLKNIIRRLPDAKKQWVPFLLFNIAYRKTGKFIVHISKIIPLNYIGRVGAFLSYHVF